MKTLFLLSITFSLAASSSAQVEGLYAPTQRHQIRLSTMAVYQRFEHGEQLLEQTSFPVSASVQINDRLGMSLRAGGAASTGSQGVSSVSGLADAQLGMNFLQPVGSGSVLFSLGANLPSGRRELEPDEFATSILLSQKFYGFRQPVLGQGLAVSPGATLALPLGETFVIGAGAGYQYKGSYTPISTLESDYDPGDEILLTLGADLLVAEASAVSADVTYTLYGADEVDGETVYDAGDKISGTLQYLGYRGFHELRVVARYASRAKGELPATGGNLVTEDERSLPDFGRLQIVYRRRTASQIDVGFLAQARTYGSTRLFSEKYLGDVGILPELRIADAVTLTTRFVYTFGSFSGLEAGVGIAAWI